MHSAAWMIALAMGMAGGTAAQAQSGLAGQNPENRTAWPQWQGRLALGTSTPAWHHWNSGAEGLKVTGISLLGDYYFSSGQPQGNSGGSVGGFRTTSGLMWGSQSSRMLSSLGGTLNAGGFGLARQPLGWDNPWNGDSDEAATPYLGLGYSRVSTQGGWGFSADIGVVSTAPRTSVRLGRAGGPSQSLEDMLRDMRFSPLLHLGVSYSF